MPEYIVPFGVWVPFVYSTRPPNHEEWDNRVTQRRNITQTEAGLWTGEERTITRAVFEAEYEKEKERQKTAEDIALSEARAVTTSYELALSLMMTGE